MKLRNLKSGDEYATIRTENQKEEDAKRINDLSKIEKKIIKYSEDLTAGMQAISSVRILLEIYRPNYVDLTLVDLPGIYYGDERMTGLIKRVYTDYISNPQSIILYVTASNNDLNTGEALAMARKVDPDGIRTLMIATKIDMRDKMSFAK
jgi:dynamin 1-like protein